MVETQRHNAMTQRKPVRDPVSTFAFNGSNSSNSGDSGTGSHTYHIPNYATSYASEHSHLITVSLGEDQGGKKLPVLFFIIFCAIIPVFCYMHTMAIKTGIAPSHGFWGKKTTPSVVWGELRPGDRCVGFGTREYSAQLLDTSLFSNWADFCDTTQMQIYGRVYDKPERCERNDDSSKVLCHWLVKSEKTNCTTSWIKLKDKGCIAKGFRRMTSRFSNIKGEDINIMCSTTPATINGVTYDKPASCVKGILGMYGEWEVRDSKCVGK